MIQSTARPTAGRQARAGRPRRSPATATPRRPARRRAGWRRRCRSSGCGRRTARCRRAGAARAGCGPAAPRTPGRPRVPWRSARLASTPPAREPSKGSVIHAVSSESRPKSVMNHGAPAATTARSGCASVDDAQRGQVGERLVDGGRAAAGRGRRRVGTRRAPGGELADRHAVGPAARGARGRRGRRPRPGCTVTVTVTSSRPSMRRCHARGAASRVGPRPGRVQHHLGAVLLVVRRSAASTALRSQPSAVGRLGLRWPVPLLTSKTWAKSAATSSSRCTLTGSGCGLRSVSSSTRLPASQRRRITRTSATSPRGLAGAVRAACPRP